MDDQIVIQDCGCLAIPETIAIALGMSPGIILKVTVDKSARSITLTAPLDPPPCSPTPLAACPVSL